MNNLEQVVQRAKADIAKKYVFVHMQIPQLETLIAGLEDLQRENERMKEALEWYGDQDNYDGGYLRYNDEGDAVGFEPYIEEDYGQKAQEVLSTLSPCTP